MQQAADHLAGNDPVLAPVIAHTGLCTIVPHTNYYWELVDGIISQQLSVKAAAAIEKRFQDLFKSEVPSPEQINRLATQNNWAPYETVACWYIWHAKDTN